MSGNPTILLQLSLSINSCLTSVLILVRGFCFYVNNPNCTLYIPIRTSMDNFFSRPIKYQYLNCLDSVNSSVEFLPRPRTKKGKQKVHLALFCEISNQLKKINSSKKKENNFSIKFLYCSSFQVCVLVCFY